LHSSTDVKNRWEKGGKETNKKKTKMREFPSIRGGKKIGCVKKCFCQAPENMNPAL